MRLHDAKPRKPARRDGYGADQPLEGRRQPSGNAVGWAPFASSCSLRGERRRAGGDRRVGAGHVRSGVRITRFVSGRKLIENLVVHDRAATDAGSEKGRAKEQGNGSSARVGSSERIRSSRWTYRGRSAGKSEEIARRTFSNAAGRVHIEGSARIVIQGDRRGRWEHRRSSACSLSQCDPDG